MYVMYNKQFSSSTDINAFVTAGSPNDSISN